MKQQTANQRLRIFRERAGLRQEAIAAELDISLSLVQKIEVGQKDLSDKMIDAICRRYSIPREWLVDGKGELSYKLEKENPYRDTLYNELRDQISFLRSLLKPGKDFLRPIKGTARRAAA